MFLSKNENLFLKKKTYNLKNKVPLAQHFEDHPLKGEKQSRRDCHIRPDLVLIYKLDEANNKLILERIGSHSELFRSCLPSL